MSGSLWFACDTIYKDVFVCVRSITSSVTQKTHFFFFFVLERILPLNFKYLLLLHIFGCCALLWYPTASSPFSWLKEWRMCKCFPLSSVYNASDWNEECQCQCRPVKLCEYLRHIHSLLSFVVGTIMSAETPHSRRLHIWENMCTSFHDLPHFSIWDRRLHHLTSSKQLKGFIIWLARRRCHRVRQWHEPVIWNRIFRCDGMASWWSVPRVEGGESLTFVLTRPTDCEGFSRQPLSLGTAPLTFRQPSVIDGVLSVHATTCQHEAIRMLPREILSRTRTSP